MTGSRHTQNAFRYAVAISAALILTGCGTINPTYKPTQVGTLHDAEVIGGLQITLQPDKSTARIGDQLTFSIKIKNVGTSSVMVPSEPDVLLTWVYPDGKRDNFIQDDDATSAHRQVVRLDPGDEMILRSALTTYYFNNNGITEFRAMVSLPDVTRAGSEFALQKPITSNGYGVMFEN